MTPGPTPLPAPAMGASSSSDPAAQDSVLVVEPLQSAPAAPHSQKICVVGSGVSGLAAAWHLQRSTAASDHPFQVTLLEKDGWIGGHACTVEVPIDDDTGPATVPIDLGFMVFNQLTYPNMMALYRMLGVKIEKSCMSLSVSVNLPGQPELEWASDKLLCQPINALRPRFWLMVWDMIRFNRAVPRFLQQPDADQVTLREFVKAGRYSNSFVDNYLLPFISAIWSSTYTQALDFPAKILFRFIDNHRLAQVNMRPQWYTVSGRSREYVKRIVADFEQHGGQIRTSTDVKKIERETDAVIISTATAPSEKYDQLVIAAHAPQALQMLGRSVTPAEKDILGCFTYASNDIFVHTDERLMPTRKKAWMSWNCIRRHQPGDQREVPMCVSYWLNRLQNLNTSTGLFVTLNPTVPLKESSILHQVSLDHPIFTQASVDAQLRMDEIQGRARTWFCGAYTRYGFHEDGLISGLDVAKRITGQDVPWASSPEFLGAIERGNVGCRVSPGALAYFGGVSRKILFPFRSLARRAVMSFIDKSVAVGSLSLFDRELNTEMSFGQTKSEATSQRLPVARIEVTNSCFYSKILATADIGLAEAYINGDCEVSGPQQLTELFKLFIANRDVGTMNVSNLICSYFGRIGNSIVHRLLRRNSLAGSKKNIEAHYDLSNDMFGTFLGETWMYSCALWEKNGMSLDQAQRAKLDRIIEKARIKAHHHVLEIGFGWGECAIHMAQKTGCRVTGLTLSHEQLALAVKRAKAAGVSDRVEFLLCDYRHATGVYDRIVSIEMMEAIGHEFLGTWFAAIDRLLAPDGLVVTQVITTPENRYEAYRSSRDFINTYIFPGGCAPSNQAILSAMSSNSNLVLEHQENFGPHYATTLAVWREHFLRNRTTLERLGFDEGFIRTWIYYFCYCEAGFSTRSLGLLQMVFTRPNNVEVLGGSPRATSA